MHPSAFQPGSAAATTISRIDVLLWQLDTEPTYDLAIPRSYAASFHPWLRSAVAALAV
ncbi:MAG: hypothetical protein ACYCZX_00165 [Rhodospirillaceae bacterium]